MLKLDYKLFKGKYEILKSIHSLNKWEADTVLGATDNELYKTGIVLTQSEHGLPSHSLVYLATLHAKYYWRQKE